MKLSLVERETILLYNQAEPMACLLYTSLIACMLMNTMSSCSMMAQSIGSVISGTTYPSDVYKRQRFHVYWKVSQF